MGLNLAGFQETISLFCGPNLPLGQSFTFKRSVWFENRY